MKEFQLDKEYTIILKEQQIIPQETITINSLKRSYEDNGTDVTAKVYLPNLLEPLQIQLWSPHTNPTYIEIGVFTDSDVDKRILEVLPKIE